LTSGLEMPNVLFTATEERTRERPVRAGPPQFEVSVTACELLAAGACAAGGGIEDERPVVGLTEPGLGRKFERLPRGWVERLEPVRVRSLRTQQRAKSQCQIMHNPVLGCIRARDGNSFGDDRQLKLVTSVLPDHSILSVSRVCAVTI
jgi:hypothetical protein